MEDYVTYAQSFFASESLRDWAERYLEKLPKEVEGLISRGSSGCAIASAMCVLSKRPLTNYVIRKPGESTHTSSMPAGFLFPAPVAIVDDFTNSGDTIRYILMEMSKYQPKIEIVAILVAGMNRPGEFIWKEKAINVLLVH